jgi:type II secretory pathway predicted ATPase ExeA
MNLRQLVERSDRPFASQPQVGRYFPASSAEEARRRLSRSIERGDGPGVAIGPAGIGKSLLLQVLAAQYREKFDVVLLASAQLCTRRALLQAIHFELGLDYRRRDEGELRLSLLDTLLSADEATEGLLLLVDEAQALAVHLLEELRLLTNLSRGGVPRVRLVIAGLPALEEKLTSPELQSFSQRLAARCYLGSLTRAETAQYVRAQLAASKVEAERLFAPAAYDAIFTASDGVPRLVNQVCDRALQFAESRGIEMIDASVIQAAWADLQQLPTSWEPGPQQASHAPAASNVVEFGSLPDEPTTASTIDAVEQPTELDDEEPSLESTPSFATETSLPPAPARRPRVLVGPAPEAIDPFAEPFEEEELVLDSFVTLASIFGTRAPRVENCREPSISRLVQNALDAFSGKASVDVSEDALVDAEEEQSTIDSEPAPPSLRLAIVEDGLASPRIAATFTTAKPESASSRQPSAAIESRPSDNEVEDASDAILVIEDEPIDGGPPSPGVRRESYRQLFSRLRYGA